jgi:hypothetical protein
MINATYNGQTYQDVTTLVASDGTSNATVTLTESGGGGDVGGLTEYSTQTLVLEEANGGVTFEHGLSKAPSIIKMTLNYSGDTADHKGIAFAFLGFCNVNGTSFGFLLNSNSSTGALTNAVALPPIGDIPTEFAKYSVDATNVKINRSSNAYHFDTVNSYTIECWA